MLSVSNISENTKFVYYIRIKLIIKTSCDICKDKNGGC